MPRMLKSMQEAMPLDIFASSVNSGMYGGGVYPSQRSTVGMLVAGASRAGWEEMRERQGDHCLVYRGDVVVYQEKFLDEMRSVIGKHCIHDAEVQEFRKAIGNHMQGVWRHFRAHTQISHVFSESTAQAAPKEAA